MTETPGVGPVPEDAAGEPTARPARSPLPRPERVPCPKCGMPVLDVEGPWECRRCRTSGVFARFSPPVLHVTLGAGEGRCAAHPSKDAIDACGRCGAFVCDVCRTRTGEQTLCPACFDVLHGRGELATTQHRRRRWDHLSTSLFVISILCSPVIWISMFTLPLACAIACWALWRRRTRSYLTVTGPVLVLFCAAVGVGGVALLIVAASEL